ncbi:MAG: auxin efflux carrier family protein [Piscirickettsiaceae bacterium]|nr:MAG: auxin efflux carrier family protein [Piscirickettsiaceae bacterium]
MSNLIPMVLVLSAGVLWQRFEPGGVSTQQLRSTLSALVVNLMAPALILYIMLTTPLQQELYQVPFVGIVTISLSLGLSIIIFSLLIRSQHINRAQAGALILAASFGNGMGIAVPTIEALYNEQMTSIPLIYDLLATVPFVWIIAVLVAAHYGTRVAGGHLGRELLLMPPVWAIVIALSLRYFQWVPHDTIIQALKMVGLTAIPLLLLMVGVNFKISSLHYVLLSIPALLIKLLISPMIAITSSTPIGLEGDIQMVTAITAAAPAVIVGIALAERFKLDSALFCTALTLGTVSYIFLAPNLTTLLVLFL